MGVYSRRNLLTTGIPIRIIGDSTSFGKEELQNAE
nr:MAG TPA: hypothetical protein [Caudoviricetes sp.]